MINLSKVAKLGLIWVKWGIGKVAHLAAQTNMVLVLNMGQNFEKFKSHQLKKLQRFYFNTLFHPL